MNECRHHHQDVGAAGKRAPRPRSGPLAGIRVADFCWMGVGALATRLLADMGAEVIKIEDGRPTNRRLDMTRRVPIYKGQPARPYGVELPDLDPNASGMFNNYNRNKLGVAIDMREARGREVVERLIARSDIVTENFAPGVMERWGLDYKRISTLSPTAIFARMSGFGHDGPYQSYRSYGPVVQACSGLSHISGLPNREPSGFGMSYMDNQAANYNCNAILTALFERERSGGGCEIDVSAVEVGVSLLGPMLLDVLAHGGSTRGDHGPTGNGPRYGDAAPHGLFPTIGEDQWIAIVVRDDKEWAGFSAVVDATSEDAGWTSDARFSTRAARHANRALLEERIGQWTRDRDKHELMHHLQAAGVPAAAVQSAEDLIDNDPQIRAREVYFGLDHPVIGPALFEGVPIRFSRIHSAPLRSAPLLGEDNAFVLKGILGMSDDEFADLETNGIIS